ncbi:MAG: hypothetical protein GY696_38460 [Gammaproteobacteria bacterium]|nr:hypothetical protein [Gammaproteobacteria bacterium]
MKLTASVKGTGKVTKNVFEEIISAPKDSTELTLAANGVHGSIDEERLDNIHSVLAETATDVWEGVDVTAVSDATPGVLTITAPGVETDTINYKVLYVPVEDSWCSIPPKVVESALRVSQCTVNVGGTWDGSAFVGGRDISTNVKSIEYACNNNLEVKFGFGAGGAYASRCVRNGREQTLKLNKDFRDTLMQSRIDNNETFGVRILAEGAMFDDPHKYQVELIFPMVGVLSAPISADGKKLAEAGDLTVLEHETYGSVIAKVKNEVAAYAG